MSDIFWNFLINNSSKFDFEADEIINLDINDIEIDHLEGFKIEDFVGARIKKNALIEKGGC